MDVAVPEEMDRSTTTCPCAGRHAGCRGHAGARFPQRPALGLSNERLGIMFHGNTITHIDSPCHIFWDGTMYNGRSRSLVDAATGSA
jgi:hypothetical protein